MTSGDFRDLGVGGWDFGDGVCDLVYGVSAVGDGTYASGNTYIYIYICDLWEGACDQSTVPKALNSRLVAMTSGRRGSQ